MNRRTLLQTGIATMLGAPLLAAWREDRLEAAADVLTKATADGSVRAAVLHVRQRDREFTRVFGQAGSEQAMFLLGSISKPICVTALMTLFDHGQFALDDPLSKFLPAFTGEGRETVTLRHLLTHVSGLPDQLPENNRLRAAHAPLAAFVEGALHTPLQFAPGARYRYSSMGILLACHVAELISGSDILTLVNRNVLAPLEMNRSAQGLGRFAIEDFVPVQTERAAPESGGGDPNAKNWDWNSPYWRKLGAPWGGTHASAPDIGRLLAEFMLEQGKVVKPATARLMIENHNPGPLAPRGIGWNVSAAAGSPGCSEKTFGHTGSTGTLAWADPQTETICVVLTSLPAEAMTPHPREMAAAQVAAAAKS